MFVEVRHREVLQQRLALVARCRCSQSRGIRKTVGLLKIDK